MSKSAVKSHSEESKWVTELYDPRNYPDSIILDWYDDYKYVGFDREEILDDLELKINDKVVVAKIIMVCALRGPVRAASTMIDGKTMIEWGIPIRRKPGNKGLSCGRITAATADLAAYFLKKCNAPKRLNHQCPAWLQFPSAGSIDMPSDMRRLHKDFSTKFSVLIGGEFKEEIYMQMETNSYLDPRLSLF
jgi:hypothetical protein